MEANQKAEMGFLLLEALTRDSGSTGRSIGLEERVGSGV